MKSYTARFQKKSNLLFTCEHASGRIPRMYKKLGLRMSELECAEGDWYDVGALDLTLELSRIFNASYLYANFSRLLIDYNRRPDATLKRQNTFHTCALKEHLLTYDGKTEVKISIPGNHVPDIKKEESQRWNEYVRPYLETGLTLSDRILEAHKRAYVFQVHTFSPIYNGEWRSVDIGILYDQRFEKEARQLVKKMRASTSYQIGNNQPWGIDVVDGGIFKKLHSQENVSIFTLEVKNTLVLNKKNVKAIARVFAEALTEVFPVSAEKVAILKV